jgi:hypothetical protein
MSELVPFSYEAEVWKARLFITAIPMLFEAAYAAFEGRDDVPFDVRPGASYRVNVAAGMLAVNVPDREHVIKARGNIKPYAGSKRVCAEQVTIGAIESDRNFFATDIAGAVVLGTGDMEVIASVGGLWTPTLLPCRETCKPMLTEHRLVAGDLPIITRDDRDRKSQAFVLSDITKGYDEDPAILQRNTFARPRYTRALDEFDRVIVHMEKFAVDQRPSPAALAVSCIVKTAAS